MRRIFSIIILAIFVFLIVMIIVEPVRIAVFNFILFILGPAIANSFAGAVSMILNSVGLLGFAGIIGVVGLITGVIVHFLWVKMDWSLRRWGATRISKDLGASPMTHLPSTPVGATTRPATTKKAVVEPEPEPVAEVEPEK